jgi:hypothetical protein
MKRDFIKSAVLHLLLGLGVAYLLSQAVMEVVEQERRFVDELRLEEEETLASEVEAVEEMLEEQVEAAIVEEFTDKDDQELSEETLGELKTVLEHKLDEMMAQVELDQLSFEELEQFKQDMRQSARQEMLKEIEEIKVEQFLRMLKKKIKEDVVPQLRAGIEHQLKTTSGQRLRDLVDGMVNKKLNSEAWSRADQSLIRHLMPQFRELAKEEVSESLKGKLIPQASEQLMESLEASIQKLNCQGPELRKAIESLIRSELEAGFAEQLPEVSSLTLQLEADCNGSEQVSEARAAAFSGLEQQIASLEALVLLTTNAKE